MIIRLGKSIGKYFKYGKSFDVLFAELFPEPTNNVKLAESNQS
jgi:hypothetical protein